ALDGVVEAVDVAFAPLLGWLTVLALVAVAARAAWHRDRPRTAAVLGWLAGFLVVWRGVTATKALVDRPRPPASRALEHIAGFSYPSGHVTAVASVGMLLVVASCCAGRYRWVAAAGAVLATLVTGFDRVYLGVHYPTDVLGAVLGTVGLGLLVVAAVGPRAVCRTRRRAWGDGAGGGWDGR
ncbi:MAG: phosphatase PAP2 family protein, partial [Actinocatenispora sp.]